MNDADVYRKRAKHRQMAEKAISPLHEATWLRLAEDWQRLAESVDGRAKRQRAAGSLRLSRRSTQKYHSSWCEQAQARRARGCREPAPLVEPAHARPSGGDAGLLSPFESSRWQ